MSLSAEIRPFFDEPTNTITYLVFDPETRQAAVIDPVLDYDPASGEVDMRSVAAVLAEANRLALDVRWALETHVHADHLSGAPYIKAKTGAQIGIGARRDPLRAQAAVAVHPGEHEGWSPPSGGSKRGSVSDDPGQGTRRNALGSAPVGAP